MSSVLFAKKGCYQYYIENDELYMFDVSNDIKIRVLPEGVKVKEYNDAGRSSYTNFLLGTDGKLYTWGENEYGQLGRETDKCYSPFDYIEMPGAAELPSGVYINSIEDVLSKIYVFFVLASDGLVYSWGHNFFGELGRDFTNANLRGTEAEFCGFDSHINAEPIIFPNGVYIKSIKDINNNNIHMSSMFAQANDGNIYSWGDNRFGLIARSMDDCDMTRYLNDEEHEFEETTALRQLGCSKPKIFKLPGGAKINSVHDIVDRGFSYFVIADNGLLYTWGYNMHGQLARDISENDILDEYRDDVKNGCSQPKSIILPDNARVKCAKNITELYRLSICVLADNGKLYIWGGDTNDPFYYKPREIVFPNDEKVLSSDCVTEYSVRNRYSYHVLLFLTNSGDLYLYCHKLSDYMIYTDTTIAPMYIDVEKKYNYNNFTDASIHDIYEYLRTYVDDKIKQLIQE